MSTQFVIFLVLILLVSGLLFIRLRRLYREVNGRTDLSGRQQTILKSQIGAMALYLPLQMAALILPVSEYWQGIGMVLAGLSLLFMGILAISNRLMVSFNRGGLSPALFVEGSTAAVVGVLLLVMSLALFYVASGLLI